MKDKSCGKEIARNLFAKLAAVRWGGNCLISLFVSILSGIIIALQYNPAAPFHSTVTVELVAPFGSFWRGLHYYSSQAFFFLLLFHFLAILYKSDQEYKRSAWIRLTLSIPLSLLLLFTGYVLRGDATGEAAGAIAENITLAIPIIGNLCNNLLFDLQSSGMKRVYANHLIGLLVLGIWSLWPHLRKYGARWRDHFILLALLLLISVAIAAPMEIERFGMLHINGPWFFLGLQELLRYFPPLFAGVIFPGLLLGVLFFLPPTRQQRSFFYGSIALWLFFYLILSLIGYARG